ncbi:MAG: tRNA (N6-isopentenyl adenosine(37)-C2)-methylthiotransferase MiaB [Clostridia bacterium]|nr:tRNA (N6-isopentenyl adenosine(37)-C2)-methylthiotransferase MiaB [Clostridia bacterium]
MTDGKDFKAHIITLGCQQNEADSERISGALVSLGYTVTDDDASADLIIINTCAIREHAERRALSFIGRYKHNKTKNPDMVIGVCGCMMAQKHRMDQVIRFPYVDFAFGTGSMHRLPEFVYTALTKGKRKFIPDPDKMQICEEIPVLRKSGYKAWVSIMYGCNNFCTYCIVPYVRGRERSRMPKDIIAEVKELIENGYKDITLLGQNVNSYGKDLDGKPTVAYLINEISKLDGDFWLHLMTSHPKDATSEMIDAISSSKYCANCFHLPLQSGSDAILKKMNRHYDIERYLSVVSELKEKCKDITLTTDIIVGFPGETEEDFQKTLDVVSKVRYDSIYTFIYSPRKGTPAAVMEEQIPEEIQKERFNRLVDLQNSISKDFNDAMVGKTVKVLVDGKSKNNENVYMSRTENNRIVHFESDKDYTGQFINIKITRGDTFALYGEI